MTYGPMADDYMPIMIRDELFALDKECDVPHREILDAVTKGIPIETRMMKHTEHSTGKYEADLGNSTNKATTRVDITNI